LLKQALKTTSLKNLRHSLLLRLCVMYSSCCRR